MVIYVEISGNEKTISTKELMNKTLAQILKEHNAKEDDISFEDNKIVIKQKQLYAIDAKDLIDKSIKQVLKSKGVTIKRGQKINIVEGK